MDIIRHKIKPLWLLGSFAYLSALGFFYFKYVPLIPPFQIVLIPILLLILAVTSLSIRLGVLVFVFLFPLINNLPYFFGIDQGIPHAPTALVLFLAFSLGFLFHVSFSSFPLKFSHPIFKPLIVLSLMILISGIISYFRFGNFYPILSDGFHELVVNVNGVRAGGAVMSVVFSGLNYLTGFFFFFILFNTIDSKAYVKKLLTVLSFSLLISLLFSLVQMHYSIETGNASFWIQLNRINSTFKDPNSFGIVLSSSLPLILGMFLAIRQKSRLFFLFMILFALYVFPSIGSRSGLLGLALSAIIFFILTLSHKRTISRRKIFFTFASIGIFVVFVASFLFLFNQSNLYKRLGWSVDVFKREVSLNEIFLRKFEFWSAAINMMKDYPATGVGVGSYIVEMPNYLKQMGRPFGYTDSAENYFFQVGSELGLAGILVIGWLFFYILKYMWITIRKYSGDSKDRFILIGAFAGVFAVFMNFFLHSYIGSFEVKYFLWLMIAILLVWPRIEKSESLQLGDRPKFIWIGIIFFVLYAGLFTWNSLHYLTPAERTKKFGWEQNFGLYDVEMDNRRFQYRWAKKTAGIAYENLGKTLVIPLMASHPNIENNPVEVKVFLADRYFNKDELIESRKLTDNEWVNFEYKIPQSSADNINLVFETSRSWQPSKYLGVPDSRRLAVGLGMEWYRYSSEVSKDSVDGIKIISSDSWEGPYKNNLLAKGESFARFHTIKRNIALRLFIKGQKALELGPYVIVRLDGKIIARTVIEEEDWTSLVMFPQIQNGEHILGVEFVNDLHLPALNQDRNVFLGNLEILYLIDESNHSD
jgi:hypothetical protein